MSERETEVWAVYYEVLSVGWPKGNAGYDRCATRTEAAQHVLAYLADRCEAVTVYRRTERVDEAAPSSSGIT